jgi:hypothetical protein
VFENNNLIFTSVDNATFSYFQTISIKPIIYNAINQSYTDGIPLILRIICDPEPIGTNIPTLNTAPLIGCRIKTINGGSETTIPFSINNITNNGASYSFTSFDNNQSLEASSELLYTNGMYVTPGIDSPEKYYINYLQFYGGEERNINPDYSKTSILNSTRYVTFAWYIGILNCTKIVFKLENMKGTLPAGFKLYYRIEDNEYPTIIGQQIVDVDMVTGSDTYNSYGGTNWIIGISSNYSPVSTSNYSDTSKIYSGYTPSNLNSPPFYTVSLSSYNSFSSSIVKNINPQTNKPYNYCIYCRIEIPLNSILGFSFSGVSAQLYTS